MGYKMDKVAKNFRKNLILFIIVWFVLTILFVAPMSIAIKQSTGVNGNFSFPIFIETIIPAISSFNSITKVFASNYIGTFFSTLIFLSGAGRLGLPIPKSYTFSAPYFSFNLALSVYMLLMAALLSNSLDIFSEIIGCHLLSFFSFVFFPLTPCFPQGKQWHPHSP